MPDSNTQEQSDQVPRVFISYAHERPDHKRWVARLGNDLRSNGVDAILDQWDLQLGEDVTLFMEEGISQSDRVLLICTPTYKRKADEGKGGVGYERLVVTGELAQHIETAKFIFLLRDGSKEDSIPVFAQTRVFVDFRDDSAYDVSFEELLRALHNAPAEPKPPLGPNPFKDSTLPTVTTQRTQGVDIHASFDVEEVYARAERLLRQPDLLGWKRLVRNVRRDMAPALIQWRENVERDGVDEKAWVGQVGRAIGIAAPLMVLALTAVDSEVPSVKDQRGILDDFAELPDWKYSGRAVVVEVPGTIAYTYHHILGALLIDSHKHADAVELLMTPVANRMTRDVGPLWQSHGLMGWPNSLGGHALQAWKFLLGLFESQPWIRHFFVRQESFTTCLRAYTLTASLIELAYAVHRGIKLDDVGPRDVPPLFACDENLEGVVKLALPSAQALQRIADTHSVKVDSLREYWPSWRMACARSLSTANFHVAGHLLGQSKLALP